YFGTPTRGYVAASGVVLATKTPVVRRDARSCRRTGGGTGRHHPSTRAASQDGHRSEQVPRAVRKRVSRATKPLKGTLDALSTVRSCPGEGHPATGRFAPGGVVLRAWPRCVFGRSFERRSMRHVAFECTRELHFVVSADPSVVLPA